MIQNPDRPLPIRQFDRSRDEPRGYRRNSSLGRATDNSCRCHPPIDVTQPLNSPSGSVAAVTSSRVHHERGQPKPRGRHAGLMGLTQTRGLVFVRSNPAGPFKMPLRRERTELTILTKRTGGQTKREDLRSIDGVFDLMNPRGLTSITVLYGGLDGRRTLRLAGRNRPSRR